MDRKSKAGGITLLVLTGLALSAPLELAAQVPVDENGEPIAALEGDGYSEAESPEIQTLTDTELEELVGPVALYPDDLLAIVLPASTYPLEIVQAARFLDELAQDSSLEPDESWDESVVALLNYPEVVYMMDKEIDWTWQLGEAVINQQADVLAAVESFRERAYAAGNLESDERQTVSNEEGIIEIEPVDEEIIYVPYYEPEEVVVYQPRRVYYYYPHAYPVYYYPYPVGYSFASGYFWGVTTAFTIGWHNHYLHVHHPSYWGHPYYGRHYYGHFYRRPSISVFNHWYVNSSYRTSRHRYRDGDYWRPRHHRSGSRPVTQRVRNYHYSGGDRDSGRIGTRSHERTRQNVRQENRTGITVNNNSRRQTSGDSGRSRQNVSSNRIETGVVGNDTNPRRATENRQRNRTGGADRTRVNRSAAGNASQQRLTAGNSRQAISNSGAQQSRQAAQRNTPPRTSRATRTSTRQSTRREAPVQRQMARPAVQRQAPPQRQATRPAVQRQAPPQRRAAPPATQPQTASRKPAAAPQPNSGRSAAPANRGQRRSGQRQRH
jgi:hypothetical protein